MVGAEDGAERALGAALDAALARLLAHVEVAPVELLGGGAQLGAVELPLAREDGGAIAALQRLDVEGVARVPDGAARPRLQRRLWQHESLHALAALRLRKPVGQLLVLAVHPQVLDLDFVAAARRAPPRQHLVEVRGGRRRHVWPLLRLQRGRRRRARHLVVVGRLEVARRRPLGPRRARVLDLRRHRRVQRRALADEASGEGAVEGATTGLTICDEPVVVVDDALLVRGLVEALRAGGLAVGVGRWLAP